MLIRRCTDVNLRVIAKLRDSWTDCIVLVRVIRLASMLGILTRQPACLAGIPASQAVAPVKVALDAVAFFLPDLLFDNRRPNTG